MAACHSCGAENREGYKFCRQCGARAAPSPSPETVPCPSCRKPLRLEAQFCRACGSPVAPKRQDVSRSPGSSIAASVAPALVAEIPEPPPPGSTPVETPAPSSRKRLLALLLGGGTAVLLMGAFAWYWISTAVERQFRQAVEKQHLVSPARGNAMELYQRVVREKGSASSTVRKLRQIALPALQSKSDELFRQWYSQRGIAATKQAWRLWSRGQLAPVAA